MFPSPQTARTARASLVWQERWQQHWASCSKTPALDYTETEVEKEGFEVTVDAQDLCPRYIAHYVYDVKLGQSLAWMRRRLALVGNNSISNIVDITNYIMRELGQPLHAFDCDFLEGNAIQVRRANEGEKIVTLDEKEFTFKLNNLVICDGKKPVAFSWYHGRLKFRRSATLPLRLCLSPQSLHVTTSAEAPAPWASPPTQARDTPRVSMSTQPRWP